MASKEPHPIDKELTEDDIRKMITGDERYYYANAIGSAPARLATDIRNLPSMIFEQNSHPKEANAFKRYINETPTNAAEGLFKGVLSVGNGIFQGVTGVFVEPVKQAKKDGAKGFARGVGKGLAGVVLKPVAGVIDLAGKTTQGIINTPITVYEAIKATKEHEQFQHMPKTNSKNKIFGIPIEESVTYCEHAGITHVAVEATRYLLDCVEEEGLFRISGNAHFIAELKDRFDTGETVQLTTEDVMYGPADIAGLLKLYFRTLPEPLLTFDRYDQFCDIQAILKGFLGNNQLTDELRMQLYKQLINTLPSNNKIFLQQLLKLLKIVSQHAEVNLMRTSNLATVFGPVLLFAKDGSYASI